MSTLLLMLNVNLDNQSDVKNPVEDPVPIAEPAEGRGKHFCKETKYIRLLKKGRIRSDRKQS